MNLKDLTPNGIKVNEAKMTPAKVQKAQKDLVTTIDALKKNFPLYKSAKESGDEKKLKKHRDIALKLTKKKKDLEKALDAALSGLYQDAELELKEANPDGTISPNEDKEMKELLDHIEQTLEDLLYEADMETKRLGGSFRAPGYRRQVLKLIEKMLGEFERGY
tara:strand:- start:306 stop:794 length:489 start_codon:yes stop_codon:yes gene_type:complete